MGIVEKLKDIGIKPGQPADILLDSGKQLQLIQDYGIDIKGNKFCRFRCIISPNTGSRKYSSPVLGHTRESRLPASSLQLGIFSLLYFDRVLPLIPIERRKPKNSFELKLYKISDDKFDLRDLVRRYNLHKVYYNFLSLGDDYKKNRTEFICGYESTTYQKFLKVQKVGKKAFVNEMNNKGRVDEPKIEVIECIDDASKDEFETLMASRSPFPGG